MTTIYNENLANEGKYLWSKLLQDVKENTSVKLSPQRNLLVLGDSESGKTTLISRLKNTDNPNKSYGLEYQFIDVKDEDRDDQAKLGVYIFDGNIYLSNLIKYALNESNFADTLALIVVSMQEPWNIMDSLNTWYEVLKIHCNGLKLDSVEREENKQSLVRHFQEYTEPHNLTEDGYSTNLSSLVTSRRYMNPLHPPTIALHSPMLLNGSSLSSPVDIINQDNITLPLPEGVLEHNVGIPIIVVVTKTDTMDSLAKNHNLTEEHFDVIQMHIRKFCLARGAALFYTSVKEDKNCDLLKRYIYHRVYGFPFVHSAYIVEKDCAFVPTGWDTLKKIKILEGNLTANKGKVNFNEWIPKPLKSRSSNKDIEITAAEEQVFLERISRDLEVIQSRTVQGHDTEAPHKMSPKNRQKAVSHMTAMKTKLQMFSSPLYYDANLALLNSPSKKILHQNRLHRTKSLNAIFPSIKAYPTGLPANNAGDGVLATFFNSLLKKPNSPMHSGNPNNTTAANLSTDLENDTLNESNSTSRLEVQKSGGVS